MAEVGPPILLPSPTRFPELDSWRKELGAALPCWQIGDDDPFLAPG